MLTIYKRLSVVRSRKKLNKTLPDTTEKLQTPVTRFDKNMKTQKQIDIFRITVVIVPFIKAFVL